MAKPTQDAPAVPVAPTAAPKNALEEFCAHLSLSDKRVELIAAFHHVEASAKRIIDTFEAYKARFEAFVGAKPATPKDHAPV